jgi:hypothetical protein
VKFVKKKFWRVAKIMQTILFFAESLLFRGEDISLEKFPIFREKSEFLGKKNIFGKNFDFLIKNPIFGKKSDFSENTRFGKKSELMEKKIFFHLFYQKYESSCDCFFGLATIKIHTTHTQKL